MLYFFIFLQAVSFINALPLDSPINSSALPIDIEEAPYQVLIDDDEDKLCSGIIISPRLLLTNSHCAESPLDFYTIYSGLSRTDQQNRNEHKVVEIEKVSRSFEYQGNVAFMVVDPPFKLDGKTVKAVELPTQDESVRIGSSAELTGYGIIEQEDEEPQQLMSLSMEIIDRNECQNHYEYDITEELICATHPRGKEYCNGDQGSPLVQDGRLIGIATWTGAGCTKMWRPAVYIVVSAYRNLIDEYINAFPA